MAPPRNYLWTDEKTLKLIEFMDDIGLEKPGTVKVMHFGLLARKMNNFFRDVEGNLHLDCTADMIGQKRLRIRDVCLNAFQPILELSSTKSWDPETGEIITDRKAVNELIQKSSERVGALMKRVNIGKRKYNRIIAKYYGLLSQHGSDDEGEEADEEDVVKVVIEEDHEDEDDDDDLAEVSAHESTVVTEKQQKNNNTKGKGVTQKEKELNVSKPELRITKPNPNKRRLNSIEATFDQTPYGKYNHHLEQLKMSEIVSALTELVDSRVLPKSWVIRLVTCMPRSEIVDICYTSLDVPVLLSAAVARTLLEQKKLFSEQEIKWARVKLLGEHINGVDDGFDFSLDRDLDFYSTRH